MLRRLADLLNVAAGAARRVRSRHPDEAVLFATAATILETSAAAGWSLGRLLQRRGTVVVTDAHVCVQSSFVSPLTLVWLAALVFCTYDAVQLGHAFSWAFAAVALLFLLQRLPFSRDVPFESIRSVTFDTVRGSVVSCDTLLLQHDAGQLQLVTARQIPETVRDRLTRLGASKARAT